MTADNTQIVIVTYHSAHLLRGILAALADFDVVVYDNGSDDGAEDICLNEFSNVSFIGDKINLGYGRAANRVIRNSNASQVLLLNPDVHVEAEHVTALASATKELDPDWLYVAPYTGHSVKNLQVGNNGRLQRITHATGCALLINVNQFRELGGFDENIFLYYEEMDLSVRAEKAKLKMYYAPFALLPHESKNSVSSKVDADNVREWHFQWSSLYYKRKHHLWGHLAESIIKHSLVSYFRQLNADEEKTLRTKVRRHATLSFLFGRPAIKETGEPYIPGL